MNDETKKNLVRIGVDHHFLNMSWEEYLEYHKKIKAEQELERRKNDPKYVNRYTVMQYNHDGDSWPMCEDEHGPYVLYEDFFRFVTILQKQVDEAYQRGLNTDRDTYSWRV